MLDTDQYDEFEDDDQDDGAVEYTPSPTGERFHACDKFVRGIVGPVGSGKSTMCATELLRRAMEQEPDKNGVRSTRWLVVRNSYAELKSTTIKTCEYWWGGLGRFVYDAPIRFESLNTLADGTVLDFQVWFLPLDRPDQIKKLKSLEVTGVWVNEAGEVPFEAISVLAGRIGRYPKVKKNKRGRRVHGPTWRGMIMDTNPPPIRSWWFTLFETDCPDNHEVFRQPGGLIEHVDLDGESTYTANPDAENLEWLDGGADYYLRQMEGREKPYIDVMLLGKYGASFDGKPVYPQFRDTEHVTKEVLDPLPKQILIVGMDFGLQPAAVFTQMTSSGAVAVIDECVGEDITFEVFLDEMFIPQVASRYQGYQIHVIGDPSGKNRSALSAKTVFEQLRERGFSCSEAVTNDFILRRDAVAHFLGRRDRFMLSPNCERLREGFGGGYRYAPMRGKSGKFRLEAEKDAHSHPADALQYACLYYYRQMTIPTRIKIKSRTVTPQVEGGREKRHYA